MMPVDTGVELKSNGATVAKVAVMGGYWPRSHVCGSGIRIRQSFVRLTAVHFGGNNVSEKYGCTVRHTNGVPLLNFDWNCCEKARAQAARSECPVFCSTHRSAARSRRRQRRPFHSMRAGTMGEMWILSV